MYCSIRLRTEENGGLRILVSNEITKLNFRPWIVRNPQRTLKSIIKIFQIRAVHSPEKTTYGGFVVFCLRGRNFTEKVSKWD